MQAKSRNDDAFWRKHVLPNFRPSISEKIPQKNRPDESRDQRSEVHGARILSGAREPIVPAYPELTQDMVREPGADRPAPVVVQPTALSRRRAPGIARLGCTYQHPG
jgi:hypothetical protein